MHFGVHSYKRAHDLAVLTLKSCIKQCTPYAMLLLLVPVTAMVKLPLPQLECMKQAMNCQQSVLNKLQGAMRNAASSSNPPPAPPRAVGTQLQLLQVKLYTPQHCTRQSDLEPGQLWLSRSVFDTASMSPGLSHCELSAGITSHDDMR